MTGPTDAHPWYVDIRTVPSPEKISLDLSRHLPRRVMVGPVAIIHSRPEVFLPVLKRRWVTLTREVERHYASTLDHFKKQSLRDELDHLANTTFSVDLEKSVAVHVAKPGQLCERLYNSIYVAIHLEQTEIEAELANLRPNGLLVLYTVAASASSTPNLNK